MITIHAIRNVDGDKNFEYDFKGLSTDAKPSEWGGKAIEENSLFLELDTGDFYYFNGTSWTQLGQAPEDDGGGDIE